ncbi:MAG: zinc ribbon domain-containing protein [Chloroflexi bacterium]|nr:zinc ribbon domain-containing protein [Chloroflexota bacterium]
MEANSKKISPSFCQNCGTKITKLMTYCPECGTKIDHVITIPVGIKNEEENLPIEELDKSQDGKIRWFYEVNLWKNTTILLTVFKVLLIAIFLTVTFLFFVMLLSGDSIFVALRSIGKIGLLLGLIFLLLGFLAYVLIAIINRGKYFVVFEMDEKGINHIDISKTTKEAQLISALGVTVGILTRNLSTTGANLSAWSRKSMYSAFNSVKIVKPDKKRNTIFLNTKLSQNQVYASEENFDSVLGFIVEHCPKAKLK